MLRNKTQRRLFSGLRPAVYARQGRLLGIRQPLARPVFDTLEDAKPLAATGSPLGDDAGDILGIFK